MSRYFVYFLLAISFLNCKSVELPENRVKPAGEFTIAFGSCNRHNVRNLLWDDVLAANPDVWIWGGDIIYADTDDPRRIARMYEAQKSIPEYARLIREIPVIGTWDDHDYGLNDGGAEFESKEESQQVFLDFMGLGENDPRRQREGIYASHEYVRTEGKVKILVLDTRYHRSALTPSAERGKRYQPGKYGEGTMLGESQWVWLEQELRSSDADFNIIVSSIQFLSGEHGFETWGNFPHEADWLKTLIVDTGARGVIILSGDRHISEFSEICLEGLTYPLIDFTSSGLTHVYSGFSREPNPYRVGDVVTRKSFGLLQIDFEQNQVQFTMIGDKGEIFNQLTRQY